MHLPTVVDDLLLSERRSIVPDPAIPLQLITMLTRVTDVELSVVDKPHHTRQEGSGTPIITRTQFSAVQHCTMKIIKYTLNSRYHMKKFISPKSHLYLLLQFTRFTCIFAKTLEAIASRQKILLMYMVC